MWIDRWLSRWSRNYAFLHRAVDQAGRELARKPYEDMLQPGEELSFTQFVDGVRIDFEVEVFRLDSDGTMHVRVKSRCDLPTLFALTPAFVFSKLPDGRAFTAL